MLISLRMLLHDRKITNNLQDQAECGEEGRSCTCGPVRACRHYFIPFLSARRLGATSVSKIVRNCLNVPYLFTCAVWNVCLALNVSNETVR
jgi:hypothetical protein